jgi:hypothetical protein
VVLNVDVLAVSIFVDKVEVINQVVCVRLEIFGVVAEVTLVLILLEFIDLRLEFVFLFGRVVQAVKVHVIFVAHETDHPCACIHVVSFKTVDISLSFLVTFFSIVVEWLRRSLVCNIL